VTLNLAQTSVAKCGPSVPYGANFLKSHLKTRHKMCPLSVLLLAAGPLGGAVGDVDAKRSRSSEQRASPFDHHR